jgi:stage V sporulation protein D (sporulation-specific penicillin-binding protein)
MTLGIEKFYNYVKAFGFYDTTGIELPGEANSIIQKKPNEIDMATASFGQSFQVTPIQIITAYSAIENDGKLVKPRIVKALTDSKGNVVKEFSSPILRNVISKQTSDTLKNILEGVVSEGTGMGAYIKGYRIAGKTGTSETFKNGKRSKERYVASFMGFAPADNPKISVLVMLDNPSMNSYYGGKVSAPVASKIIQYALDNLSLEKNYN